MRRKDAFDAAPGARTEGRDTRGARTGGARARGATLRVLYLTVLRLISPPLRVHSVSCRRTPSIVRAVGQLVSESTSPSLSLPESCNTAHSVIFVVCCTGSLATGAHWRMTENNRIVSGAAHGHWQNRVQERFAEHWRGYGNTQLGRSGPQPCRDRRKAVSYTHLTLPTKRIV